MNRKKPAKYLILIALLTCSYSIEYVDAKPKPKTGNSQGKHIKKRKRTPTGWEKFRKAEKKEWKKQQKIKRAENRQKEQVYGNHRKQVEKKKKMKMKRRRINNSNTEEEKSE